MVRCPNCGQKTSGDYCQWCNYPILKRRVKRRQKTKTADPAAKEKARQDAIDAGKTKQKAKKDVIAPGETTNTYQGNFNLIVQFPEGYEQVQQFEQYLKGIESLKILWTGGSQDEGAIIASSVQKPMPLIRLLSEIPVVEQVAGKEKNIIVMLKTPTAS